MLVFALIVLGILIIGYVIANDEKKLSYIRQGPTIEICIDATGKHSSQYEDLLDKWVTEHKYMDFRREAEMALLKWKDVASRYVNNGLTFHLNEMRTAYTYLENRDPSYFPIFSFIFLKSTTRYKQINYQKYPYQVTTRVEYGRKTIGEMEEIRNELAAFNFETTRKKHNSKNQRSLMTKELRREIILRDGYTCQICGKYMPDEVGLHVDHIIPVSKGGKTIPSNLQVLCDKCNLTKGSNAPTVRRGRFAKKTKGIDYSTCPK